MRRFKYRKTNKQKIEELKKENKEMKTEIRLINSSLKLAEAQINKLIEAEDVPTHWY